MCHLISLILKDLCVNHKLQLSISLAPDSADEVGDRILEK